MNTIQRWFHNHEQLWSTIGTKSLRIILIIIITAVVVKLGKTFITNFFRFRFGSTLRVSERRENTLVKLLDNVFTYVIYFICIITILSTLSIDIKGIIAGAGIVGLAVGFGAQTLVKDIIAGFFIIFEDQFSVGDIIRIGQQQGEVMEIGLRTTKYRSWTGELFIIPNGSIKEVTNFSLYNGLAIVDVHIPYETNVQQIETILESYLEEIPQKYEEVVSVPQLLGVEMLGTSDVSLRIVCETLPTRQWAMARLLRGDIKEVLQQHGIKAPFPKLVTYEAADKSVQLKSNEKGES